MHPNRLQTLNLLNTRNSNNKAQSNQAQQLQQQQKVSEIYGSQIFNLREMQNRLPREVFEQLKKVIHEGHELDTKLAGVVAEAVRAWAISKGVTHFTHWFQPMTGLTAEKHDAFISFDKDGSVIEKFSASQLIQSEPDASSFPSGGMRSTFEARGYTAWDASSPLFIVDHAGTKVLCIPSVFVSYTGHSLDTKTGLIRSIDALNKAATALLNEMGDSKVSSVTATIGCEQEYFLIDQAFIEQRPDILLTGRTLLGGDMPKGQQLEDHYFGAIPARVQAFMADAERELYKLGVPVKTRHNEVAPSQFETAPIFEEANLAADHNMLTMEVFKRTAEKHGFACLMHEKPFAGINGSGKHCNWSMGTDTGENLLEPGTTPHTNFRFIAVLACVMNAVHKAQVALRAAIASHGNDHRLGANEAPPAIISIFLGSTLSQILDAIQSGADLSHLSAEKAMIQFGLNRLPAIPKDNTDRNRTSPFAFTGNKFEFRAVGSSHAISFPMTVLNAAVAESIKDFTAKLKDKKKDAASIDSAVLAVAKEFFASSRVVHFEGDGYSQEWRDEAHRRGLPELLKTPESFKSFHDDRKNHQFLLDSGTYKKEEIDAIVDIRLERYVKHMDIEAQTLVTMIRQYVIPSAQAWQAQIATSIKSVDGLGVDTKNQRTELADVTKCIESAFDGLNKLQAEIKSAHEQKGVAAHATAYAEKVAPTMAALRTVCDKLESVIADELWPLPKYREMLFIR